ncbi:unnamed protein product [Victoria cruziana]
MQVIPPGEPKSRSAERGAACLPFLKALEKPSSVYRPELDREVRMRDMLETFRVVCINLPLLDAIQQVPAYARFLKELCTRKRKSRRVPECVMLSAGTSSLLQRRFPPKLEDPGLWPTSMTIQMADRSVKRPRGVLEDVLLKIDDFIFFVDFIVLDMEGVDAEHQTPIILGRPFLATANACINCRTGILEIFFVDQCLKLNMFQAAMGPAGDRCISFAEADSYDVDEAAHEHVMAVYMSRISDQFQDVLPGADDPTMLFFRDLGF